MIGLNETMVNTATEVARTILNNQTNIGDSKNTNQSNKDAYIGLIIVFSISIFVIGIICCNKQEIKNWHRCFFSKQDDGQTPRCPTSSVYHSV